jgi:hypothetical protein
MRTLVGVWGVIVLFLLVMVGIYGGIFTPTEAAGIGASGAFLFALYRRQLTWKSFYRVLLESAGTTAMLFMVLIGATFFSDLVNFAGFAEGLVSFVTGLDLNRWGVLIAIMLICAREQVGEDHHTTEPGAQVDEGVVGPHRGLAHRRQDLVHAARQIGHRAAGEVRDVGRRGLDPEHLVEPDVAIERRDREESFEQGGAAERARLDLGASRTRPKP